MRFGDRTLHADESDGHADLPMGSEMGHVSDPFRVYGLTAGLPAGATSSKLPSAMGSPSGSA